MERRQWRLSGVLLSTLNIFHLLPCHVHCWNWTSYCWLGSDSINDWIGANSRSWIKILLFLEVCWSISILSNGWPFYNYTPARIYLFNINNRNTRTICEFKVNIKTTERRRWRRFGVFIVNSEHNSHVFLVLLLLILNK